MVFEEDEFTRVVQLSDSEDSQIIRTSGRIQEISCLDFQNQTSLLGIRNEYCCSFLSDSSQVLYGDFLHLELITDFSILGSLCFLK